MNFIKNLLNWKTIIFLAVIALSIHTFLQCGNTAPIADKGVVKEWITDGALIVDVRTPQEFAAGNYKGSINIPLADIEKNLNKFGAKDRKIIVYCRTGNRSGQAKKILESHGFTNILNGGGLSDMP